MTPLLFLLLAAGPVDLFNGKDLTGWESRGDGIWTVVDGVLVGQRNPKANPPTREWPLEGPKFANWLNRQAWLYTVKEYREYDLSLEYWMRVAGNSGIAIHDTSRGAGGIADIPDFRKTPSKVAYEIQINNRYPDPHPTGSIYSIVDAKPGAQKDDQWNRMEIAVRKDRIRVKVNGAVVAEAPTDPNRPSQGPIGLQLHDQYSLAMFRKITLRELP
jgi:hypothetical protein